MSKDIDKLCAAPVTPGITPEDQIFCNEYVLSSGNAGHAARESGSKAKNPSAIGWKKLQNPIIQAEIQRIRELARKCYWIETDKIISKLHRMMEKYTDTEYETPAQEFKAREIALNAMDKLMRFYGMNKDGNNINIDNRSVLNIQITGEIQSDGLIAKWKQLKGNQNE